MTESHPNLTGENAADDSNFASREARANRTGELIEGYLEGLTDETLRDVLTQDGRGDCLYCQMGDVLGESEHLISHLREKYYMPHLVLNAYRSNNSHPELALSIDRAIEPSRVRETIGMYLKSALIENIPAT